MKLVVLFLLIFSSWSTNEVTVEKHPNLLFYIERNLNQNTVVYEANFDANGQLHKKVPIKAHWIMFEKHGEDEQLNYAEQRMAYGVKCTPDKNREHNYRVRLVADESRLFTLEQTAPFKAHITTVLNGEAVQLTRLYIKADNSSFWPAIDYVLLEGKDLKTDSILSEKVRPEK
jgi:hypothetical protein